MHMSNYDMHVPKEPTATKRSHQCRGTVQIGNSAAFIIFPTCAELVPNTGRLVELALLLLASRSVRVEIVDTRPAAATVINLGARVSNIRREQSYHQPAYYMTHAPTHDEL